MVWIELSENSQLAEIKELSANKDVLIFKHSTTCSISLMAKYKLEDHWDDDIQATLFYLDVKKNRAIAKEVAEIFEVVHESPQVLLIREGEVIHESSHFDISVQEIKDCLAYHG